MTKPLKYEDIPSFAERCEFHPDHQTGMISESMLKQRLHEEIDELREYIEQRTWVGLTAKEKHEFRYSHMTTADFIEEIEAKLRSKNRSGQE